MNYFPATSHFIVQATRHGDAAKPSVKTQSSMPIASFGERLHAEHCVKRLAQVHAFDGYVLIDESFRSFEQAPTLLSTTVYDAHGSVVAPRRGAGSR
jgi:hypothetical protein